MFWEVTKRMVNAYVVWGLLRVFLPYNSEGEISHLAVSFCFVTLSFQEQPYLARQHIYTLIYFKLYFELCNQIINMHMIFSYILSFSQTFPDPSHLCHLSTLSLHKLFFYFNQYSSSTIILLMFSNALSLKTPLHQQLLYTFLDSSHTLI